MLLTSVPSSSAITAQVPAIIACLSGIGKTGVAAVLATPAFGAVFLSFEKALITALITEQITTIQISPINTVPIPIRQTKVLDITDAPFHFNSNFIHFTLYQLLKKISRHNCKFFNNFEKFSVTRFSHLIYRKQPHSLYICLQ